MEVSDTVAEKVRVTDSLIVADGVGVSDAEKEKVGVADLVEVGVADLV